MGSDTAGDKHGATRARRGFWRRALDWLKRRLGAAAPSNADQPAPDAQKQIQKDAALDRTRTKRASPPTPKTPPEPTAPRAPETRKAAEAAAPARSKRAAQAAASPGARARSTAETSKPRRATGPSKERRPSRRIGGVRPFAAEAEGFAITGVERPGAGSDAAALILIHGAGLDHRDWTFGFLEAVPLKRRVLAFDRPGFGGSGRPRLSGALPATQARLLRGAARALGVRRALLVGHSWGGAVAMAWALQDADGVDGVVSLAGAVAPWSLASTIEHGRRMRAAARTAFSGAGVRQAAIAAMEESFAPATIPDGYVAHIETDMGSGGLLEGPAAALAQDIATINGALGMQVQNYGGLAVPVELVYGDADRIVSAAEQADVAAAALPDARVTILPGAGHMIQHTHRAACLAAIASAAARAEARPAA